MLFLGKYKVTSAIKTWLGSQFFYEFCEENSLVSWGFPQNKQILLQSFLIYFIFIEYLHEIVNIALKLSSES